MALIVFLIGGVYSVGSGSVALGASMNRARIFETRVSSFTSVWREYLETLPPGIRFSVKDKKLLIENGTVPFAWTREVRRADAVQFSLDHTPGEEGSSFMVRHLKRPKKAKAPDEYELVAQLPLLENVRALDWSLYEPVDKKWLGAWDPKKHAQPPLFMRMHFAFVGDPREFEYTFWVANDFITPQNPAQPAPAPGQQQPVKTTMRQEFRISDFGMRIAEARVSDRHLGAGSKPQRGGRTKPRANERSECSPGTTTRTLVPQVEAPTGRDNSAGDGCPALSGLAIDSTASLQPTQGCDHCVIFPWALFSRPFGAEIPVTALSPLSIRSTPAHI